MIPSRSLRLACLLPLLASPLLIYAADSDVETLSRDEVLRRIVAQNLRVQVEHLNLSAARHDAKAEKGLFEPQFVASFTKEANRRQNTRERFLSQATQVFDENNEIYVAAVESILPTGAKLRVGGQTRHLNNNLQTTGNREYETYAGVSVTQPLLKGVGLGATLAQLRIATAQSDITLHETRRQLTTILSQAELTYWDLVRASGEYELRNASLGLGSKILDDNKARVEAGRMSDLEVFQAEAGLSLRRAQADEARQKVVDLSSLLRVYFGEPETATSAVFKPSDEIALGFAETLNLEHSRNEAFKYHPAYLSRVSRAKQESLRLGLARNQRLPQLDVKAGYGLNGLDNDFHGSVDYVRDTDFPSWYLGAELRVPILAGVRERHTLSAARNRSRAADLELQAVEIEIANLLNAMIKRLRSQEQQVRNYRSVAEVSQRLLDAELGALDVGRSDSRKVLDAEQALFEAKSTALSALIEYKRSATEFAILEGTYLRERNLDLLGEDKDKVAGTVTTR